MLTARGDEIDEVVGLEVGADDFLTKPVRSRALLARLQARLRRAPPQTRTSTVRVGSLTVDPGRRSVELDSVTVDVSTAEFDLLYLLARNAGEPLSRNYIHQEVFGVECGGISRSIDLRVSRLRKKLGDDATRPQRIKSVRGIGYMLAVYP